MLSPSCFSLFNPPLPQIPCRQIHMGSINIHWHIPRSLDIQPRKHGRQVTCAPSRRFRFTSPSSRHNLSRSLDQMDGLVGEATRETARLCNQALPTRAQLDVPCPVIHRPSIRAWTGLPGMLDSGPAPPVPSQHSNTNLKIHNADTLSLIPHVRKQNSGKIEATSLPADISMVKRWFVHIGEVTGSLNGIRGHDNRRGTAEDLGKATVKISQPTSMGVASALGHDGYSFKAGVTAGCDDNPVSFTGLSRASTIPSPFSFAAMSSSSQLQSLLAVPHRLMVRSPITSQPLVQNFLSDKHSATTASGKALKAARPEITNNQKRTLARETVQAETSDHTLTTFNSIHKVSDVQFQHYSYIASSSRSSMKTRALPGPDLPQQRPSLPTNYEDYDHFGSSDEAAAAALDPSEPRVMPPDG